MDKIIIATILILSFIASNAHSQDQSDLAKQSQNPISDLISLPLQSNFDFNVGPNDRFRYTGNIQPVIPFKLSENWNLVTRTILPLLYQPDFTSSSGGEFGISDTNFSAWLSPRKPGKIIWGIGPAIAIPTATDDTLGTGKWAAGPTVVALVMPSPWVIGFLVQNIWSFAGDSDREDVNFLFSQVFANYNLSNGWYLVSAPIITANWKADSSDRWTIPIGGGAGKVFRMGELPINTSLQAYYNVEKPELTGADWQLRWQFQFLFPR